MNPTDMPRFGMTSALALAAGSAALTTPAAAAAPGEPIGAPIIVANSVNAIRVARAANGRMVASYLSAGTLMARRYAADGAPLGEAIAVTPLAGREQSGGVAIDADGDFVIAWSREDERRTLVMARRYTSAGTAQGDDIEVASLSTPDTTVGSVVDIDQGVGPVIVDMNADGDFGVLYGDYRTSFIGNRLACKYLIGAACVGDTTETLRLRRFDAAGVPRGPANLVTTATENDVTLGGVVSGLRLGRIITGADIETRADGSTLAAWSTQTRVAGTATSGLYTRVIGANGLARLTRPVGPVSTTFRGDLRLDSSANGSHVLVHRSLRSATSSETLDCGVELDLLAGDGSPLRPRIRVDQTPSGFDCLSNPDVSMDAAGNHVVAFREGNAVLAQRYAVGGGALGGLFNVTDPGIVQQGPVIASDAVGNFVIGYTLGTGEFVLRLHQGP